MDPVNSLIRTESLEGLALTMLLTPAWRLLWKHKPTSKA